MHRVREAFHDPEPVLLDGVVVVDEIYVGGLEGNKHWGKKLRAGRGTAGNSPIVGAIERGGRMIAKPVAAVSGEILEAFVAATVQKGAWLSLTTTPDTGTCLNGFSIIRCRTAPENMLEETSTRAR